MINGEITASLDPVIECILLSSQAEHQQLAVIDTGFNGFLSAPDTLLVSMG